MPDQGNGNIFDSNTNQSATGDQPQADATPQGNQPQVPEYLSGLVGDGKKYGTIETAMQSIPAAQDHISRLEQENADLRSKMQEAEDLKTLIEKQLGNGQQQGQEPVTAGEPLDIDARIDERMNARSHAEKVRDNLLSVDKAMKDKFGDKAQEQLALKAAELGVGVEFLQNTASASPKAFLAYFGMTDQSQPVAPSASVQSSVNTEAMGNHNRGIQPGTKAYYDNLRKTNRAEYYSTKVQMQLNKDMMNPGFNT